MIHGHVLQSTDCETPGDSTIHAQCVEKASDHLKHGYLLNFTEEEVNMRLFLRLITVLPRVGDPMSQNGTWNESRNNRKLFRWGRSCV